MKERQNNENGAVLNKLKLGKKKLEALKLFSLTASADALRRRPRVRPVLVVRIRHRQIRQLIRRVVDQLGRLIRQRMMILRVRQSVFLLQLCVDVDGATLRDDRRQVVASPRSAGNNDGPSLT